MATKIKSPHEAVLTVEALCVVSCGGEWGGGGGWGGGVKEGKTVKWLPGVYLFLLVEALFHEASPRTQKPQTKIVLLSSSLLFSIFNIPMYLLERR